MKKVVVLAAAALAVSAVGAQAKVSRSDAVAQCVAQAQQSAPSMTQNNTNAGARNATALYSACMRRLGHRP